jgi:hypothetical protein
VTYSAYMAYEFVTRDNIVNTQILLMGEHAERAFIKGKNKIQNVRTKV